MSQNQWRHHSFRRKALDMGHLLAAFACGSTRKVTRYAFG